MSNYRVFTVIVEEELTNEQAAQILSDMEEIVAKKNLSLFDSHYDLEG